MKRMFLLFATNIAIMAVISIILSLFGLTGDSRNMSVGELLLLAAVIGFTGSFISLFMSKWVAKRSTGAVVITQPRSEIESWLLSTVERQAMAAGIKTPEVAIYDSPEVNAFATGPSKNNSLVAVSTGLMRGMTRDEVEGVLAHEISHVANGDMVTLALIQGVVNTFVVFLARIIANVISNALSDKEGGISQLAYMAIVIVLQILFGFLASFIVMWFSRQREYRADAGSARIVGRAKMIAALKRLQGTPDGAGLPKEMAAMGIAGGKDSLLSTHPSLENRIAALENMNE